MSRYTSYGVTLTKGQCQKIKRAYDNNRDVTIRISKKYLSGDTKLPLTETQINQIRKTTSGIELTLSKAQLKYMGKNGGFLPLLLAAIPAAIGAIGGLAGGITSAVNSTRQTNEQKRHNLAVESMAKGSGILSDAATRIPIVGKTLSNVLKKIGLGGSVKNLKGEIWGKGLYLERQGSGLFLARQGK